MVQLYGRLEDGRAFLVRDRRGVPHFYVEATTPTRRARWAPCRQAATDQVTLAGRPVVRVEVADTRRRAAAARPADARPASRCYEADVRFAMRLPDRPRHPRLASRSTGRGARRPGIGVVFDDPELAPAEWTPRLGVLSLDIETDPRARRLLSIALHGCGASEVLLLTPDGRSCPPGARPFASEAALLAGLRARACASSTPTC